MQTTHTFRMTSFYCLICAVVAGLYVGAFYILNNLAMFSAGAILLVLLVFLLPLVATIAISIPIFRVIGFNKFIQAFTAFCALLWILVALYPMFREVSWLEGVWAATNKYQRLTLMLLLSALFGGWVFRKSITKLTVVISAMLIASIFTNFQQLSNRMIDSDFFASRDPSYSTAWFKPVVKPNVYFILSDGMASFEYLGAVGYDATRIREYFSSKAFTVYDDTFANIHPTLLSMASILNFRLVEKNNEEQARQMIANPDELKDNLSNAGYRLEYHHMADYLLLRGCLADVCYPNLGLVQEARAMFSRIIGKQFVDDGWKSEDYGVDRQAMLDTIKNSVANQRTPTFRYIHYYDPAHVSHAVHNNCDAGVETEKYLNRVHVEFANVRDAIDQILDVDPNAIIIYAGDHGPWIDDNCSWSGVPQTLHGLRDRISAAVAVRWPDTYSGEFDKEIFSTVNLIKYVMYSMMGESPPPDQLERENLYVLGYAGVPVEVVKDGQLEEYPVNTKP